MFYDELRKNTEWLVDSGARTIVPCGNTGEYYSLSNAEREDIVIDVTPKEPEEAIHPDEIRQYEGVIEGETW